jgi:hypothetical protein
MEQLGERPAWSMSGSELLDTLDQVDAELARLETYRLRVIARVDEVGHAREIGAYDTAQLLEFRYRLDRARARRDVKLALALPRYDAVSAALPASAGDAGSAGSVGDPDSAGGAGGVGGVGGEVRMRPAQAEVIVAALEKVPATVPVEDVMVAERELVTLARHLSPSELRRAGQRVRDVLDTDGPEPAELQAYQRESLMLSVADHGVNFRGYLANENAELLRSLVHAGARPRKTGDGELDPRSRDKRQADALTATLTVAAAALDSGEVPGFGAKATITVTMDLDDLKSADGLGDVVYGDGLSAATVRRLACDAKVIPLVLGSNSEPLDVGRSERLVTRAMRRALNRRDKGCVICGAPPIYCDAHHLKSWTDGGETCVGNLALVCRRHHLAIHAGEWSVVIVDGVVHVDRPAWVDPPTRRARPQAGVRHTPAPLPAAQKAPDEVRRTAIPAALEAPDEVRRATYVAIWGEPEPPPPGRREHREEIDPWGVEMLQPAPTLPV